MFVPNFENFKNKHLSKTEDWYTHFLRILKMNLSILRCLVTPLHCETFFFYQTSKLTKVFKYVFRLLGSTNANFVEKFNNKE